MKQKRIKTKYLPQHLQLQTSVVLYLLLDKLNAPGWVWGVAFSFMALLAIGAVMSWFQCDFCEPEWKKGE